MSNSATQVRHLISTGAVKKSGGSLNIANGQVAFTDNKAGVAGEGLKVVSSFVGYSPKEPRFILTVGEKQIAASRTRAPHNSASIPFSINQVVEMGVSVPKIAQQRVDEWRIGYDGLNPETTFDFKEGMQPLHIRLRVEGGAIPYKGGNTNYEEVDLVYDFNSSNPYKACISVDPCTPIACKPIIEDIIKTFEQKQIGGGTLLKDAVEIFPILSCENSLGEQAYTTCQLTTCDTGDTNALALVQAAVSNGKVVLKRRNGSTSTYEVMVKGNSTPAPFTPTVAGMLPKCGVCESGNLTGGGFLYYVIVEDNGTDETATIEGLVANSEATRIGANYGQGVYALVTEERLTPTQETALITGLASDNLVATLTNLGELGEFCSGSTLTPIPWTRVNVCYSSTKQYKISLGDDECGENLLPILQATYPSYDVVVAPSANSSVAITLAGSAGGVANINIGGVDYVATFDTDSEITAYNFSVAHASALAALGIEVTAALGVIRLVGATSAIGTVTVTQTNATLTGAVVATVIPSTGACMTSYLATVPTDIKCEDCSEELVGFYTAEAPLPFRGAKWEEVVEESVADSNCLCGIGFRGKTFKIDPERCLHGDMPYIEDSTSILVAAAGLASDGLFSQYMNFENNVAVTRISEKANRDAVAGNLLKREIEGGWYFQDSMVHRDDSLRARWSELETRFTNLDAQFVNYWVKLSHNKYAGYLEQKQSKDIIYNIYVEVGKHQAIEDILNDLAGVAGIEGVRAF